MRPSAVVVGAGAGGLFAALYLQREGHDVVVLDAAPHVGGCASAFSAQGFRFLAGATTLVGLEPSHPLGLVLGELGVPFAAPAAPANLTVARGSLRFTLGPDDAANQRALSDALGAPFARFFATCSDVARDAWRALPALPFPPTSPLDVARLATSASAWRLAPALSRSTARALRGHGVTDPTVHALVDELLLVSTQGVAERVPFLFGALGLEYLGRPLYQPDGGIAGLLEHLADTFVSRGGTLRVATRVTSVRRHGHGFGVQTEGGAFAAERVVLNLTHWDAAALVDDSLAGSFRAELRRHPDAWAACGAYAGVADVFDAALPPYHQLVLDAPLPHAGARGVFVTVSPRGDSRAAPAGFRALTVSCHTAAAAWEALDDAAHARAKAELGDALWQVLTARFPGLETAERRAFLTATPRTWRSFTGRHGGRVGGLPFDFRTLARGYPTGLTGVPGLARVGDTVFPGQSVPACAWGARRVVRALLAQG